jgi:rare lipoprotein A
MRLLGALVMLGTMLTLNAFAETGKASWYGYPYHGRKAADGSVYSMYQMTAAHRTLPFGTKILVENTENKQSVVLKVTDRGPFAKGRVLDVSKVAAMKLGMLKSGTASVKITVLPKKELLEKTENLEVAKASEPVKEEVLTATPQSNEPAKEQEVKADAALEREKLLKQLDVIVTRLKELDNEKSQ